MRKSLLAAIAAAGLVAGMGSASAGYVYVGNWEVESGPDWPTEPQAYTGQQAAALLFGGAASDYAISTAGSSPALINHQAWYSVLGYFGPHNGGIAFAENYVSSNSSQCCGLYYSGNNNFAVNDPTEAASAYVNDNADPGNINYAFRIAAVPEPASIALLATGMIGVAGIARRSRRAR